MEISVYGMHCQNCANKINRGLAEVPGVVSVEADHGKDLVSLSGNYDLEAVKAKIIDLGFLLTADQSESDGEDSQLSPEVASTESSQTYLLSIGGMSCASCVRAVETALSTSPGVTRASVNYADESAFVRTTGALDDLLKVVAATGYSAELRLDESVETRHEKAVGHLKVALLHSGLALVVASALMLFMELGMVDINQQGLWLVLGLIIGGLMYVSGGHFYRGAWSAARHMTTTMDTLVALGTSTAWIYSILVLIMPDWFPIESRHIYFDSALFVIGFVNLGKAFEGYARSKTSQSIQALVDLQPRSATRVENGVDSVVSIDAIRVGDIIRLRPGDAIPVDGVVVDGYSSVDESMLSGESMPVEKNTKDKLSTGTLNIQGSLLMRTTQVGKETVLAKLVDLIKEAQNSKPEIGRVADKIAAVFVPLVILLAILSFAIWYMVPGGGPGMAIVTMMSVLIIACPCALGLAIPMSIMVGVGKAANAGMLVKNSDVLQAASNLSMVVVDKTGTLTIGKPEVIEVTSSNEALMLNIAYSLEALSEHPLAAAIVEYCDVQNVPRKPVEEFHATAGGGAAGIVMGKLCRIGSEKYLRAEGIAATQFELLSGELKGTAVYVSVGDDLLGRLQLQDQPRPEAKAAIQQLVEDGIQVVMLTGDNEQSARYIAELVGIKTYQFGMLPGDKLAEIQKFQSEGHRVGMVGDGVNDSLALSTADVGIAMGHGSDVALQSADVALPGSDLMSVVRSIRLSRMVMVNIYQNLSAAFGYNLLLLPVAAGLLYPGFGLLVNPSFAGLAMALSSLSVVLNAMRLRMKPL